MPEKGYKFDPENLEMMAYLQGDPNCKRPGCYGHGWTGVTVEGVIIRCKCAIIKEPMTKKIIDNQIQLGRDMKSVEESLEKTIDARFTMLFDVARNARNETREEFEKINNRRWAVRLRKLFRRK